MEMGFELFSVKEQIICDIFYEFCQVCAPSKGIYVRHLLRADSDDQGLDSGHVNGNRSHSRNVYQNLLQGTQKSKAEDGSVFAQVKY